MLAQIVAPDILPLSLQNAGELKLYKNYLKSANPAEHLRKCCVNLNSDVKVEAISNSYKMQALE